MIEYDRIDNSCFDDRQEAQIINSKCTQQKKPRSSPRSSKMGQPSNQENRVKAKNNILKVQVNTNKENLKYIIKEGSCV